MTRLPLQDASPCAQPFTFRYAVWLARTGIAHPLCSLTG